MHPSETAHRRRLYLSGAYKPTYLLDKWYVRNWCMGGKLYEHPFIEDGTEIISNTIRGAYNGTVETATCYYKLKDVGEDYYNWLMEHFPQDWNEEDPVRLFEPYPIN